MKIYLTLPSGQVFNVHINGGYVIKASDCIGSLRQFTHAGAKCFGKNNQDTKGGWTDVDSLGNWYAYPWENKQLH